MTVLDLITASMHRLGYLESTETPRSADAAACLRAANDWIDGLALDGLTVHRIARQVYNLQATVGSYTIGPGGTFNAARPAKIERAGLILDPSETSPREIALEVLTPQGYAAVRTKARSSAYPQAIYYDPSFAGGLATVHVFPVPDSATPDLVLYVEERLTEFAALATVVELPTGYRRFFVTNLAIEFASILGVTPTEELAMAAVKSRSAVEAFNVRVDERTIAPHVPGMGRGLGYDIEQG